jgi:hypothetical protein
LYAKPEESSEADEDWGIQTRQSGGYGIYGSDDADDPINL